MSDDRASSKIIIISVAVSKFLDKTSEIINQPADKTSFEKEGCKCDCSTREQGLERDQHLLLTRIIDGL
jgi:hypothetical protein